LYVGNLPFETGDDELRELFARIGSVESVSIMRDMATGRARGFAFVEMGTDEGARQAIEQLHSQQFNGRPLTVNEARPRPERSGGYGGGGGSSRGGRSGGGGNRSRREPRW
jgi:RNA recognition motif-containing protein